MRLGWAAADATEEAAITAAGDGLRREGGGILLVFDNARDPASLQPYLPQGGYRRSLAITETALGLNHPEVANRLNNLAWLLHTTGRAGEAEPLFRRAFAIIEASLGPVHPRTVTAQENLAAMLAGR